MVYENGPHPIAHFNNPLLYQNVPTSGQSGRAPISGLGWGCLGLGGGSCTTTLVLLRGLIFKRIPAYFVQEDLSLFACDIVRPLYTTQTDSLTVRTLVIILLALIAATCAAQKRFFKGNTHTHSYPQSGDAAKTWTPEMVVASYKSAGYDFLVFTDHVSYWNADTLSSPDFVVFNGEEAGLSGGHRGHFTAMRIQSRISGAGKTHQQLINEIVDQGGLAFLNHPRWSVIPISAQQVISDMKQNLQHLEVFNWNTDAPTTFDTSLWDSVLTSGRQMFSVACDDAHKESHLGKGWVCVYASSKDPDTLFNAIRNGDFYASNGIVLDSIAYCPDRIYVRSSNSDSIRFVGSGGKILATVEGNEGTYVIVGNEGYVRAQITNRQNQTAWIQPLMIVQSTQKE